LHEQAAEDGGPIKGDFAILSAGENVHADSLLALRSRRTNAAEVVRAVRRRHPACVNPVNANILLPDGATAERAAEWR
jgi:hypothetical protein